MVSHDWPGNVRELGNVASVAAALAEDPGAIDDVLALARNDGASPAREHGAPSSEFAESKRTAMATFERDYFGALARRCKGNVSEMARQSGMERHHVRAYLRKHQIDKNAFDG
jgi:DNA-binding NtrC family response regulator